MLKWGERGRRQKKAQEFQSVADRNQLRSLFSASVTQVQGICPRLSETVKCSLFARTVGKHLSAFTGSTTLNCLFETIIVPITHLELN